MIKIVKLNLKKNKAHCLGFLVVCVDEAEAYNN